MALNREGVAQTMRETYMMPKSALVALAGFTVLYMAANRSKGIATTVVCVFLAILVPAFYESARRFMRAAQQRETEQGIVRRTLEYLRSQESALPARPAMVPLRRLSRESMPGFRPLAAVSPATPQASDLVVFDAIPQVPRAARVRLTIPRPAALPFGAPAPVSAAKAEFETWRAERHNMTIECAGPVLNEIRIAAVDGYQRMRHGGIEVGGVLFGTHRNGVVQVQAMRPIACEYSQGPRFILSERDQAALAEQLETSRHDLELQGLEPVGWYHSHTRSEVLLSGAEVEYFNRFFPQPWQVALVVRPANLSPVRAGYFFREANGVLRTEASYSEFQLLAPVPAAVAAAA